MKLCPNPNSPEFKALVNEFGEAIAHKIFELVNPTGNTDYIPGVEEAKKIYENYKLNSIVTPLDQQYATDSLDKKLKRITDQRDRMLGLKQSTKNANIRATLGELQKMSQAYVRHLKQDIENVQRGGDAKKTVSVSSFIGSVDYKDPEDPMKFKAFKLFGIFMHQVIEEAQQVATSKGVKISDILTREFFDDIYNRYVEEYPFDIDELSTDHMYETIYQVAVSHIDPYIDKSFIILPEVTVVGNLDDPGKDGTKIVGRVDLMLIDATGRVHILDFKTKKVRKLVKENLAGDKEFDLPAVLQELAIASPKKIKINDPGTANELKAEMRSTYDSWHLQLKVYDNILKQRKIETGQSKIIALLYQVDDTATGAKYMGDALHVFEEENFYTYSHSYGMNGKVLSPSASVEKLNRYRRIINSKIPYGTASTDETNHEKAMNQIIVKAEHFERLSKLVLRDIENDIAKIQAQLKDLNDQPTGTVKDVVKNELKNRLSTLKSFKELLENTDTSDFGMSVSFSKVLEGITTDIDFLYEKINNLYSNLPKELTPELFKAFQELSSLINDFDEMLSVMKEIVQTSTTFDGKPVDDTNPIFKKFGSLDVKLASTEAMLRDIDRKGSLKVFSEVLGSTNLKRLSQQNRELIIPQLDILRKQLADMKAGMPATFWQKATSKFYMLLSKTYREKLEEKINDPEKRLLLEIQEIEKKIAHFETQLELSTEFSEDVFNQYLNNITDPNTDFYIGGKSAFAGQLTWGDMINVDSMIAGASNSDIGIAAVPILFKNASADANIETIDTIAKSGIQQAVEKLQDRGISYKDINEKISEIRTKRIIDKDGNEKQFEYLSYVTPWSQEYQDTYLQKRRANIEATQKVREIKSKLVSNRKTFTAEEIAKIKEELNTAVAEKQAVYRDFINWQIDNVHLPFVDEFYKLQTLIPEDEAKQLQALYTEMEILSTSYINTNESEIPEEYFDEMDDLLLQIKEIKSQLADKDPNYKKYLEKFEEFFEFEENENFYRAAEKFAKIRYEGTPEWELWLERNTIIRPTDTWYETIEGLFEEIQELFGEDPVLSQLYQNRNKIKSKYRINNVYKPHLMTEEDAAAFDAATLEIENYLKNRERESLSEETMEAYSDIKGRLDYIRGQELSKSYTKAFKLKVDSLEKHKVALIKAETDFATAKNDPNATEEQKENLLLNYNQALKNFTDYETQFVKWYKIQHVNEYQSVLDGFDIRNRSLPKEFNYEYVPIEPDPQNPVYTQTDKHPKYKIKRTKRESWSLNGDKLTEQDLENLRKTKTAAELQAMQNSGELVYSQGATNKNYIRGFEGIPLPKAVVKNAAGEFVINDPNSSNVNKKYLSILNDPDVNDLYQKVIKLHFNNQKDLEGKKIGYKVAGYGANALENYTFNNLKTALEREKKLFIDRNISKYGAEDLVSNVFGDLGDKIRSRYTEQLPLDLQSRDVIQAAVKYTAEANLNKAMSRNLPYVDSFIQDLERTRENLQKTLLTERKGPNRNELEKRLKNLNSVIEQAVFERRKFAYGQTETESYRAIKKRVEAVFRVTALARMGFDATAQIKNMVSGNVQSYIAAGVKAQDPNNKAFDSDNYTMEDINKAKAKVYSPSNGFISNWFKDWGKLSGLSKDMMIYRYFNPLQQDVTYFINDKFGTKARQAKGGLLSPISTFSNIIQDKGETEVAATVMYAVMFHNKFRKGYRDSSGNFIAELDADGKEIYVNAYEAYEPAADGTLQIRADVEYTKKDETRLRNIIYSEIRRAQGNYANSDSTKLQMTLAGKFIYFYRKYLLPSVLNRFGYARNNWEAGEVALGYWRAFAYATRYYGPKAALSNLILGTKLSDKFFGADSFGTYTFTDKDGVTKTEKGNLLRKATVQLRRDLVAGMTMLILSKLLVDMIADKDDDEPIGMLEGNLARLIFGVKGETLSLNPLFPGSSAEYVKNFTSITTYTRELTGLAKVVGHATALSLAYITNNIDEPDPEDSSLFSNMVYEGAFYQRKSGRYEAGEARLKKDLMDFLPISNIIDNISPQDAVDRLKGKQ